MVDLLIVELGINRVSHVGTGLFKIAQWTILVSVFPCL